MLSGTLAHNRWPDLSRLIALIRGHPIRDHNDFLKFFSVGEVSGGTDDIDAVGMRFLQAITIPRPSTVLNLKELRRRSFPFEMSDIEVAELDINVHLFTKVTAANKKDDSSAQSKAHLRFTSQTIIRSLHPLLDKEPDKEAFDPTLPDAMSYMDYGDAESQAGEAREGNVDRFAQNQPDCYPCCGYSSTSLRSLPLVEGDYILTVAEVS